MDTLPPFNEGDCLICIDGLELSASIGIYPHEQAQRQTLLVDIAMTVCATAAAASDDIRYTVDYDQVVQHLQDLVAKQHFNLLETLSRDMLQTLAENFPLTHIRITVHKPAAVPSARQVSVTRSFNQHPLAFRRKQRECNAGLHP